jgi:hypothetical protein
MKQFNRRQLRDDRQLKAMARSDQMKADSNSGELSASSGSNEFASRATSSQPNLSTQRIRSWRPQFTHWTSDDSELI